MQLQFKYNMSTFYCFYAIIDIHSYMYICICISNSSCNTAKSALPDTYTRARRGVDISGKAQVAVSQLLCYTSSDTAVFISSCIDFDCGL